MKMFLFVILIILFLIVAEVSTYKFKQYTYEEVMDKINLLDFCNYIYGDKVLEVKNRGLFIKKESN